MLCGFYWYQSSAIFSPIFAHCNFSQTVTYQKKVHSGMSMNQYLFLQAYLYLHIYFLLEYFRKQMFEYICLRNCKEKIRNFKIVEEVEMIGFFFIIHWHKYAYNYKCNFLQLFFWPEFIFHCVNGCVSDYTKKKCSYCQSTVIGPGLVVALK